MPAMSAAGANASPMRSPASEKDFEKVRSTIRFGSRRISGMAETFSGPAKSM
jgi:hypothetical protein